MTSEVYVGCVYDTEREQKYENLHFTNREAAREHVKQVLSEVHGIDLNDEEFVQETPRLWKARHGVKEGIVVKPRVHNSAEQVSRGD